MRPSESSKSASNSTRWNVAFRNKRELILNKPNVANRPDRDAACAGTFFARQA
jgi:hypothetical protein